MTASGAGWYWRFNFGGSGHYVPAANRDTSSGGLWVAAQSSPCGQAQATTERYRGTVLDNPDRRPVYWEHACGACRAYAARHGLPLPPTIDDTITRRLHGMGYDVDGVATLLADLRANGLALTLASDR